MAATGGKATFSTFLGGINNSGTITAPIVAGIFVGGTATGGAATFQTFGGGITNTGLINVIDDDISVGISGVSSTKGSVGTAVLSTFSGGITNTGTLVAGTDFGIQIAATATGAGSTAKLLSFSGGVTNTGKIISGGSGIAVAVAGLSRVRRYLQFQRRYHQQRHHNDLRDCPLARP